MTPLRVLLVTGARSLADDSRAEEWARDLISAALDGADVLIVGDAGGPDAWALESAAFKGSAVRCYVSRGECAGVVLSVRLPAWTGPRRWALDGDTHPLKRNAAMVAHAARSRDQGCDVRVLALLDGRKATATGRVTRGTEHTAGLAQRAGLTVDRRTWNEVTP